MLMNVQQCHVILMLVAPTLMGVMNALATVGTLEMESHAQVLLYVTLRVYISVSEVALDTICLTKFL